MKNQIFAIKGAIVFLTVLMFLVMFNINKNQSGSSQMDLIIDRMPLVEDDPFKAMASSKPPIPDRSEKVRKWLEPGVRIAVTNARGSGTIVYYDEKTNTGYIQSCGHLWNGNMSIEEGKRKKLKCKIDIFYKNGKRLEKPATYPADVIYYSNNKRSGGHLCQDVSLLTFKPDFVPKFFPIAPADTQLQQGSYLHSVGCDHATEVAHYSVRVIGERGNKWPDLVTTENSPRPGRSGGGLINETGKYVGICWGTSDYDGTGNGFFTPLKTIRYFNQKNGYGWLNDVISLGIARQIPIRDRNNPQGRYPDDYIPMPGGN